MTVLNFPASPTTGDTYTENGVLYTWNGSYWDAADSDSFDDRYVEVIGDTMTGQLTLPGGGSATQALQKQEIESLVSSGTYWDRSGGTLSPEVSSDDVEIGGGKITLNADGLGEFTGGVKVTGGSATDVGPGMYKQSGGGVDFANESGDRIASFNNSGKVGFPTTAAAAGLHVNNQPGTTANASYGIWVNPDWDGNTGTRAKGIYTTSYTGTTAINEFAGYQASGTADTTRFTGTGSIQAGFWASDTISSAADTNAGFYSKVATGTGSKPNYNFYAEGSAPNYYAGDLLVGGTLPSSPNITLAADGSITADGPVGIGITAPAELLHVKGGVATILVQSVTNESQLNLTNNLTTAKLKTINNDFSVLLGGSERLRVNSSGNVHIGGTLPSSPNITLNANGSSYFRRSMVLGLYDLTAEDKSGLTLLDNGGIYQQGLSTYPASTQQHRIYYGNTLTQLSQINGTLKIGGILPALPNIQLDATGEATFQARIRTHNDLIVGSNQFIQHSGSIDDAEQITNSGTKTFRAGWDGSVGIGGVLTLGSNYKPNISLNANGTGTFSNKIGANGGLEAVTSGANNNNACIYARKTGTGGNIYEGRDAGGGLTFQVSQAGTISAITTTISALSSERRLKENIVAIDSDAAWTTIKNTPYYSYNFIGNEGINYGPMADEVPAEMVINTDRSDDEGVIRTFDNGMLQARLYTALQTALTRIEALEAEVNALKGA